QSKSFDCQPETHSVNHERRGLFVALTVDMAIDSDHQMLVVICSAAGHPKVSRFFRMIRRGIENRPELLLDARELVDFETVGPHGDINSGKCNRDDDRYERSIFHSGHHYINLSVTRVNLDRYA
uniref:hypothetical protein n=1 Tax=Brucella tritici TaxID=94626 RepID=UPI001AEE78DA